MSHEVTVWTQSNHIQGRYQYIVCLFYFYLVALGLRISNFRPDMWHCCVWNLTRCIKHKIESDQGHNSKLQMTKTTDMHASVLSVCKSVCICLGMSILHPRKCCRCLFFFSHRSRPEHMVFQLSGTEGLGRTQNLPQGLISTCIFFYNVVYVFYVEEAMWWSGMISLLNFNIKYFKIA